MSDLLENTLVAILGSLMFIGVVIVVALVVASPAIVVLIVAKLLGLF